MQGSGSGRGQRRKEAPPRKCVRLHGVPVAPPSLDRLRAVILASESVRFKEQLRALDSTKRRAARAAGRVAGARQVVRGIDVLGYILGRVVASEVEADLVLSCLDLS